MSNANLANEHFDRGMDYVRGDRFAEAADEFRAATRADRGFADAYVNWGSCLARLGWFDRAAPAFEQAARCDPGNARAFFNLGVALQHLGRFTDSIGCFLRAIELAPDHADALIGVGGVLVELRRGDQAIEFFERALAIDPAHPLARAQLMFQLAQLCDWKRLAKETQFLPTLGLDGPSIPPFTLLALEDDPGRHRTRSQRHAAEEYGGIVPHSTKARPSSRPERLRVGYFSADFHDHATMYLTARLFELHDPARFDIRFYSYGPPADDAMRRRLLAAPGQFTDVSGLTDESSAALARDHGLDIAVDLKGYTNENRVAIFAHRAAPIQVSFLGYPGTSGAPFIDYLIADRVVVPQEQRSCYSEAIIQMPNSYWPTDDKLIAPGKTPSRSEAGLPDHGFVFCCFNNSYKIGPVEFGIWMTLLQRVDGSVLWLLSNSDAMQGNLRAAASAAGVDPDRLVFGAKLPLADHLARQRLAGLFLDTFNYNAHTTASDALWVGLPLVTRIGKGFTARVAASLLGALDLGELVTESDEEYAALAFELATNPAKLAAVRDKLESNRLTSALFDSPGFTKDIEAGFDRAYDRFVGGGEPVDIILRDAPHHP